MGAQKMGTAMRGDMVGEVVIILRDLPTRKKFCVVSFNSLFFAISCLVRFNFNIMLAVIVGKRKDLGVWSSPTSSMASTGGY